MSGLLRHIVNSTEVQYSLSRINNIEDVGMTLTDTTAFRYPAKIIIRLLFFTNLVDHYNHCLKGINS